VAIGRASQNPLRKVRSTLLGKKNEKATKSEDKVAFSVEVACDSYKSRLAKPYYQIRPDPAAIEDLSHLRRIGCLPFSRAGNQKGVTLTFQIH
jgi:hypothetical protein